VSEFDQLRTVPPAQSEARSEQSWLSEVSTCEEHTAATEESFSIAAVAAKPMWPKSFRTRATLTDSPAEAVCSCKTVI
jgi:hypothetical protein